MQGVGVPLVTPFDEDGRVDESKLREVASWTVECGVDFLVPCGSNGESELMTLEERAAVTAIVADEISVPVLAGTGHPGFEETREQTRLAAAAAGADAALVVTPFYFDHDQAALEAYYRRLAEESPLPVYLYNVPAKTHVSLDPETVGRLSNHENIAGMKDSTGDMTAFQRERRSSDDFDLLVGTGALLAPALDAGGDGGVMALANVVPELVTAVYRQHRNDDSTAARALNTDLVALNQAVTARFGVPGLKAAMAHRGVPAGRTRFPHQPADEAVVAEVSSLVDEVLDEHST